MRRLRNLIIDLAIMIVAALVLAALGPFGTYALGDFASRLAYWLPAALLGYAIFRPSGAAIVWIANAFGFNRWAAMIAAVLVAAVPATIGIAWLGGRQLADLPGIAGMLPLYVNVALVGALIMSVFMMLEPNPRLASEEQESIREAPLPPARAAFLDRLSPGFPAPLLALEMEDHYVRAHGQGGKSELVLMRMRDAVAEMSDVAGEQVHRSWWVARDAVMGRRRDGRSIILLLPNGLEAPVARDRVASLRAAGWF